MAALGAVGVTRGRAFPLAFDAEVPAGTALDVVSSPAPFAAEAVKFIVAPADAAAFAVESLSAFGPLLPDTGCPIPAVAFAAGAQLSGEIGSGQRATARIANLTTAPVRFRAVLMVRGT